MTNTPEHDPAGIFGAWIDYLSAMEFVEENDLMHRAERAEGASVVPMPNEEHPALARYAATVRSWSEARSDPVRIPIIPRMTAYERDSDVPTSVATSCITLTMRKCAGPAPFVGDPRFDRAAYLWRAWTDEHGRTVATGADLIWGHA